MQRAAEHAPVEQALQLFKSWNRVPPTEAEASAALEDPFFQIMVGIEED
jgi:hypothetical protein